MATTMAQSQTQAPFVPIYKRLIEEYKDAIIGRELKPGDRIDSINHMMAVHGVSRETAKIVLNYLAREGFIIKRPGKGSFVADLSPRKKIWGVVLPFYSVQYEDLVHELAQQAWAVGRQLFHFISYNSWEEELRLVGHLTRERYEAIVVVPTFDESRTSEFYRSLSAKETSVSLVDHTMAGSYFPYVIQSYDLGVQRGTRYLLEHTRGSIALVRNEIWSGRNLVQELIEGTFMTIMAEERPNVMPHLIDRSGRVDAAFVKEYDVQGVFCCDDSDAIRVIGKLREEGVRIPEQVRLVSYGNTHLARYFTPAITSLDPHNSEMAHMVGEILRKRIGGEPTQFSQYVVQPELVLRDT
jgi:DNA-binding LacI/PurR family transcriptional regulator